MVRKYLWLLLTGLVFGATLGLAEQWLENSILKDKAEIAIELDHLTIEKERLKMEQEVHQKYLQETRA